MINDYTIYLKRYIKRQLYHPLKSLFVPRRFQAYSIGLERTGTTYLANIFKRHCRSCHEPEWEDLANKYLSVNQQLLSRYDLVEFLYQRDRFLRLELESSHVLAPFAGLLSEIFPRSKFILTIRHPLPWLRSVTDWQLNNDVLMSNSSWKPLLDVYYGSSKQYLVPELKELGLYTLDGYLERWARHNEMVIRQVPESRLLVVKTNDLSRSKDQIADFLEIPSSLISLPDRYMSNKPNLERHNVVDEINEELLSYKLEEHCKSLMDRYFRV